MQTHAIVLQTYSGGGSGGFLWAEVADFTGDGELRSNGGSGGGSGNNQGGGGAGGFIVVYFTDGTFKSGHTVAKGRRNQPKTERNFSKKTPASTSIVC